MKRCRRDPLTTLYTIGCVVHLKIFNSGCDIYNTYVHFHLTLGIKVKTFIFSLLLAKL